MKEFRGLVRAIFILIVFVGIVGSMIGNKSSNQSSDAVGATREADSPCKTDWSQCKSNREMMANYDTGLITARMACKKDAISKARFGTPEFPWVFFFQSYMPDDSYVTSGIAVLLEKEAKFQNEYGAMMNVTVVCKYDLRSKTVLITQNMAR